ncbi:MAG: hypothetical protein JSW03_02830, partial [Candidatus Eiseniibacteriota bacterium]
RSFPEEVAKNPHGFTHALSALDFLLGPSREIVIVGEKDSEATRQMLRVIYSRYLPNKVVAFAPGSGQERRRVIDLIQFVKEYTLIDDMTTSYVCTDYTCEAPTTDPAQLGALLDGDASVRRRERGGSRGPAKKHVDP